MKQIARIEDKFSGAFARAWDIAKSELARNGIALGASVRNKDGALFRLTTIEPHVHNFGDPLASVSCHGVKFRADGTWGNHDHWVGDIATLTVDHG